MLREERLPEERGRRVGVSGSLRGRRSEEMTQSNTSSQQEEGRRHRRTARSKGGGAEGEDMEWADGG